MADYEALLGGGAWELRIVTYSFEDVLPAFMASADVPLANPDDPGFRQLTSAEKDMLRQAFRAWSQVSGLTLVEVAPGEGDIRVSDVDLASGTQGVGHFPGEDDPTGGDVYFDVDGINAQSGGNIGYLFYVFLHEIGHALGLTHSHAEFPGEIAVSPTRDNTLYTMMSYNYVGGNRPGVLDQQAMQVLYGAADYEYVTDVSYGTIDGDSFAGTAPEVTYVYFGYAGDDTLSGGGVGDLLKGGDGDDLVRGNDGDDSLDGGDGNDDVDGGEGNDFVRGGQGQDNIRGGNGNNTLRGNAGADALTGGTGFDTIHGGVGDDNLNGGSFFDKLSGGDGNDTLRAGDDDYDTSILDRSVTSQYGQDLFNELMGGDGDDQLLGGYLSDRLEGGSGNDVIDGGPSLDATGFVRVFNDTSGDHAVFSGNSSDYGFEVLGDGTLVVTDNRTIDGVDTVRNVRWLDFADGSFLLRHLVNPELNTSPIAVDDSATLALNWFEPQLTTIISNTNDSDPDGDPLTIRVLDRPDHGNVTVDSYGNFHYTAQDGFLGIDTFTYEISDGLAVSEATVTVGVAKTIYAAAITTDEDVAIDLPDVGDDILAYVIERVVDPLDGYVYGQSVRVPATVVEYDIPATAIAYDPATGDYRYQPWENVNGFDQLRVKLRGADGIEQWTRLTMLINPVNDVPVVVAPAADQSFAQGDPVSFAFTANIFADPADDTPDHAYPQNLLNITASLADGSALPDWLVFEANTSIEIIPPDEEHYSERYAVHYTEAFSGVAPLGFSGALDIRLTATDAEGASVSDTFTLAITPPPFNVIDGTAGDDRGAGALRGTIGRDAMSGRGGNDALLGYGANDRLNGGSGNDTLTGGSRDDELTGGAGKDVFAFTKLSANARETSLLLGHDRVTDFANGADRIDLKGLGLAWRNADADLDDGFAITQEGSDVLVTVAGQGSLTLANTLLSQIDKGDFLGWG